MPSARPAAVLTTAAVLALHMGVSNAEPQPATPPTVADAPMTIEAEFGSLDTNANHLIDRAEAQASEDLERNFERLDENNDGQLSESEFSGFELLRSGPTLSESKNEAVNENAKDAKPNESWFTAPQHKPRDDEAARGREPR